MGYFYGVINLIDFDVHLLQMEILWHDKINFFFTSLTV
jgi:hypothetical protein